MAEVEKLLKWIEDQAECDASSLRLALVANVAQNANRALNNSTPALRPDEVADLRLRLQKALSVVSHKGEMSMRKQSEALSRPRTVSGISISPRTTRSAALDSTFGYPRPYTGDQNDSDYLNLDKLEFEEFNCGDLSAGTTTISMEECQTIERRLADLSVVQQLIQESVDQASAPLDAIEANVTESLLRGTKAKDYLDVARTAQAQTRQYYLTVTVGLIVAVSVAVFVYLYM